MGPWRNFLLRHKVNYIPLYLALVFAPLFCHLADKIGEEFTYLYKYGVDMQKFQLSPNHKIITNKPSFKKG